MESFEIEGGHKLQGEIIPQGAKNEALQILCATVLTSEEITIHNIPDIRDVNNLILLLEQMGVKIDGQDSSCTFRADDINLDYLKTEDFKKKRGQPPRVDNAHWPITGTIQQGIYTQTRRG